MQGDGGVPLFLSSWWKALRKLYDGELIAQSTLNGTTSIKKHAVLIGALLDHFQLQSSAKNVASNAISRPPMTCLQAQRPEKGQMRTSRFNDLCCWRGFCLHDSVHWLRRWPDKARSCFNDDWGRVPLYNYCAFVLSVSLIYNTVHITNCRTKTHSFSNTNEGA